MACTPSPRTILPSGTHRDVIINRKAVEYNLRHKTKYPVFIVMEKGKPWQEFHHINMKAADLNFSMAEKLPSPVYFYTVEEIDCFSYNDLSFLNRKEMNVLAYPKAFLGHHIGEFFAFLKDFFNFIYVALTSKTDQEAWAKRNPGIPYPVKPANEDIAKNQPVSLNELKPSSPGWKSPIAEIQAVEDKKFLDALTQPAATGKSLGNLRIKNFTSDVTNYIIHEYVLNLYLSPDNKRWTGNYIEALRFKSFDAACQYLIQDGYELPPIPQINFNQNASVWRTSSKSMAHWEVVNAHDKKPLNGVQQESFVEYADACRAIVNAGYQALPEIRLNQTPYPLYVVVAYKDKSFHLYDTNLRRFYHVNGTWFTVSNNSSHFPTEEQARNYGQKKWWLSPTIVALTTLPAELQEIAIKEMSDGWHIREEKTQTDFTTTVYKSYKEAKDIAKKCGLHFQETTVEILVNRSANNIVANAGWYVPSPKGGYFGYDGTSYGSMANDKTKNGYYYQTFKEASARMEELGFKVKKPNLIKLCKAPWDSTKWTVYNTENDTFMNCNGNFCKEALQGFASLEAAIDVLKTLGYPEDIYNTLHCHPVKDVPIIDISKIEIKKDISRPHYPFFIWDSVSGNYMDRNCEWIKPTGLNNTDNLYYPTHDAAWDAVYAGLNLKKFRHTPQILINYSNLGWYVIDSQIIPGKSNISHYMRIDGSWHGSMNDGGGTYFQTYKDAATILKTMAKIDPPKPNLKLEKHEGSNRWNIITTKNGGSVSSGAYMCDDGTFKTHSGNFFFNTREDAIATLKKLGYEEKWFGPEFIEIKPTFYVSISCDSAVRFKLNGLTHDLSGKTIVFNEPSMPKIEYMCGPYKKSEFLAAGEYKFCPTPEGWTLFNQNSNTVKIRLNQLSPDSTVHYSFNGKDYIIGSKVDVHKIDRNVISATVGIDHELYPNAISATVEFRFGKGKDVVKRQHLYPGSYEFMWQDKELTLVPSGIV